MPNITNFGEALPTPRRNAVEHKLKPVQKSPAKPIKFEVRRWNSTGEIFIMKAGDKLYRTLRTGFSSFQEALEFQLDNYDELVRSWEHIKAFDSISEDIIRSKDEVINSKLGYDITPVQFLEQFPFRGVEFGKWQDDRQTQLNKAAKALQDLSKVTKRSGSWVTRDLGISFGARGTGKASAHYEPGTHVINLTKTNGKGCLAHEWFHSYDCGLSNMIPIPERFLSRCRRADANRSKKYWSTTREMGARLFEQWVKHRLGEMGIRNDYLVNFVPVEQFKKNTGCYPYLYEGEESKVFEFFDTIFNN